MNAYEGDTLNNHGKSSTRQHWRKRSAVSSSLEFSSYEESNSPIENTEVLKVSEIEAKKRRRKKHRYIYLAVCLFFLASVLSCAIIFRFYLHTNRENFSLFKNDSYKQKEPITVSHFGESIFLPYHQDIEWITSTEGTVLYYDQSTFSLSLFYPDGKEYGSNVDSLITSFVLTCKNLHRKRYSSDMEYIAFSCSKDRRWRHSYYEDVYLVERATGRIEHLASDQSKKIVVAEWSPIGHKLVYGLGSNLFIWESFSEPPVCITDQSDLDGLFNGNSDWVYEEEILQSSKAVWWSPDGNCLSYLSIDDSKVPVHVLPFEQLDSKVEDQNRVNNFFHYSTPKDPIPFVKLFVNCFTDSGESIEVDSSFPLSTQHRYITDVAWAGNEKLMFVEVLRGNYERVTSLFDLSSRKTTIENTEVSEHPLALTSSLHLKYLSFESLGNLKERYVRQYFLSNKKRIAIYELDNPVPIYLTPVNISFLSDLYLINNTL